MKTQPVDNKAKRLARISLSLCVVTALLLPLFLPFVDLDGLVLLLLSVLILGLASFITGMGSLSQSNMKPNWMALSDVLLSTLSILFLLIQF